LESTHRFQTFPSQTLFAFRFSLNDGKVQKYWIQIRFRFRTRISPKIYLNVPYAKADRKNQKGTKPNLRSDISPIWEEKALVRSGQNFTLGENIRDVITHANFGNDRLRRFSVVRSQIVGFSIDFRRRLAVT